ncbi:MAG: RNA methyltransferase [bacterium]
MVPKIKYPIYVLLDNIRSTFNVGSIFRTSDASGISKIFICGITAYPPNPKLQKTALGSLESVEWEYSKDSIEKVKELKEQGYTIYSVELSPVAVQYDKIEYPEKTVLVMGNEINGVDKEILKISDKIVEIPMNGIKESLNVATSFGIVAYESTKSYRK